MSETWSPVVDALQIRAQAPGPVAAGEALTLSLLIRNTGSERRRVYFIGSEPFRAMQSTLFLDRGDAGGLIVQPTPRPHGYVVTEGDFPVIEPGSTQTFEQTLSIPADLSPGRYPVRWVYSNKIERWEGGVHTLDGITTPLFGGERIPGIWVGKMEYRFEVVVQPR